MNSLIVSLICTVFLYSSAEALQCNSGNPCNLTGVFTPEKGFRCLQYGNDALCTCPSGYEINMPCDPCSRTNPIENACNNATGKLIACLPGDNYGLSYACLCSNGLGGEILTSDADCATDPSVTLTSRPPTTTAASGISSPCLNGGIFANGICNCPSGYSGKLCGNKNDPDLCDRVFCKNNGTCAIRNPNGPYEAVCLCRYGTWGEYCELTGTLGFCSASSCVNGGACKENVVGTTRHAYCRCPAGYNGLKCDNRYFTCPAPVGKYTDFTLFEQGKYFECTSVSGTPRIEQKSCPRGLRFNANIQLCTY